MTSTFKPAEITSTEGRKLSITKISEPSAPDGDSWSFEARLVTEQASANTSVYDYGGGLLAYWQQLATEWRGWDGERSYRSLEGQLGITCTSDDLGQVSCKVVLGQPWPPTWRVEAELTFGGGSHIEQFAADLRMALG